MEKYGPVVIAFGVGLVVALGVVVLMNTINIQGRLGVTEAA